MQYTVNRNEKHTKVEVMWYDTPQLIIRYTLYAIESELCVEKPIIVIPKSIYPDRITYDNYIKFLEERLQDKTRDDMPQILKRYGVRDFMPVKMCRKSHGRNMTDFLWLRFDDEKLCYNDIKLRG